MINISIYEKDDFIRLRYDLEYLYLLKREIETYTNNYKDSKNKKIIHLLEPAIEVFWIKSYDNDNQHYYVSCGTSVILNSSQKNIENLLEPTKKIDIKMLGKSVLETLVNDVNSRLVNGKLNEDLIRSTWLDIKKDDKIEVVNIEKSISSKIYKKIDTLSFYYPEYNDIWNSLAEEYRLKELIPHTANIKVKIQKF